VVALSRKFERKKGEKGNKEGYIDGGERAQNLRGTLGGTRPAHSAGPPPASRLRGGWDSRLGCATRVNGKGYGGTSLYVRYCMAHGACNTSHITCNMRHVAWYGPSPFDHGLVIIDHENSIDYHEVVITKASISAYISEVGRKSRPMAPGGNSRPSPIFDNRIESISAAFRRASGP
jgi:hypothetical protein